MSDHGLEAELGTVLSYSATDSVLCSNRNIVLQDEVSSIG